MTPVLVPGEPLRFVFAHGAPYVYLLPPHPLLSLAWDAPTSRYASADLPDPIRCDARPYRSPALGWDGMIACAPGEETRLFVALRMAEIAILFCETLAEIAGRGRGNALVRLVGVMTEGEKV